MAIFSYNTDGRTRWKKMGEQKLVFGKITFQLSIIRK
jgi:hypothetical protein